MLPTPRLQLTVPMDLWEDMAQTIRPTFADSYLSGAEVGLRRILPRTQTAWAVLKDTPAALFVLKKHGLELIKPPPFEGPKF